MKSLLLIAAIASALFAGAQGFAETTVKAEVDKTVMASDEFLTYRLVVASTEQRLPGPVPARFEGFRVVSQAQSSTVSFRKNGVQNILAYVFVLLPDGPGTHTIGPSSLSFKGKSYASESFRIEVKPASGRRQPQQPQPPAEPPREQAPDSDQPQYTL